MLNAGIQMQVKFTSADTVRRLLLVKGGFCFVCGILWNLLVVFMVNWCELLVLIWINANFMYSQCREYVMGRFCKLWLHHNWSVYIYIYKYWLFVDVHGLHGLLVESAGILIEEEPRLHNYTLSSVPFAGLFNLHFPLWVYQVVAANKEHSTCYKGTIWGQRQQHQVHFVIYIWWSIR